MHFLELSNFPVNYEHTELKSARRCFSLFNSQVCGKKLSEYYFFFSHGKTNMYEIFVKYLSNLSDIHCFGQTIAHFLMFFRIFLSNSELG